MELLTASEKRATGLLGQVHHLFVNEICGNHIIARDLDIKEFTDHIHILQNMIMCQAAARAYPDEFRLAGEVLAPTERGSAV